MYNITVGRPLGGGGGCGKKSKFYIFFEKNCEQRTCSFC